MSITIKSIWVKILSAIVPEFSGIIAPLLQLTTGPLGMEINEGLGVVMMVLHYLEKRNPNATGYTKIETFLKSVDSFTGIVPATYEIPDGLDALLDKITDANVLPSVAELDATAPPLPPLTDAVVVAPSNAPSNAPITVTVPVANIPGAIPHV
jgi:hypothetical protein